MAPSGDPWRRVQLGLALLVVVLAVGTVDGVQGLVSGGTTIRLTETTGGLAIGAAFALGEAALGVFLILGFTLHNVIPPGRWDERCP